MKPDIVAKLAEELRHDIRSERQVVYILVELRKLMQLNGDTGEKSRYYALEFYCDWAVHPTLDRPGAQRIVKRFDKYQALVEEMTNASDGQKITADMSFLGELGNTLRLSKFREQLGGYLNLHGLDSTIAGDDGKWANFLRYYSGVIEDCPLKCSDPGLKFTDEVVVKVIDVKPPGTAEWVLVIEWSWTSKITGMETKNQQFF